MKFLKLEILNLASLDREGGEVIDFTEGALGDSTIFSIVGPTGSGKSTILDAICLALYNRAPRYPRKKGDRGQQIEIYGEAEQEEKNRLAPTDPRNILTRGKKEGYSKLTFLANNGMVYRAEWYVRLKTKNYDDALTSLYRLSERNGIITEEVAEWDSLGTIIGLDYDQFLRTVLIAQGSFAGFLTAKENERYELLEKLIGSEEQYTHIAEQIREQYRQADEAYRQLQAACSAEEQHIIPEEDLLPLRERVAELDAEERRHKEELGRLTESLLWYTNDERFVQTIGRYQQLLDEARRRQAAMQQDGERLALHDATLPATTLYRAIRTAESDEARYRQELTTMAERIAKGERFILDEEKKLGEQMQQAERAAADYAREKQVLDARCERNREELLSPLLSHEAVGALEHEVQLLRDSRTLLGSRDLVLQRSRLQDGQPCPLCGAVHHPYHDETEYRRVTTALDEQIATKETDLKARRQRIQQLTMENSTSDPLYRRVMALQQAKEQADKAIREKNEYLNSLRIGLEGLKGKKETLDEQHQRAASTRQGHAEALTEWLRSCPVETLRGADDAAVQRIAELADASVDWEAIRSREQQAKTDLTSAETTLQNEQKAQTEHRAKRPERSKEELLARKAELERAETTELVNARVRLQNHDRAEKQLGDLLAKRPEAAQLATEWKEINEAIGGDGKTLRKVAQCYTLRFLVAHANREIRRFNSRYELQQVKNSLGLRVIDHDRADDVRDTTSLSGGETFIVSLGLALGLSALSSRNISFENLFIDEGFGTLDPDTLATVIDSLAMLQSSQGKKVGVISHTDTMSERITTQIRIIRNGNSGSSHIEIYP